MPSKSKKEFEFKLQSNIAVHKGGERQFCNKLLIKAPNAKQAKNRCIIKQSFMGAMNKLNNVQDGSKATAAVKGEVSSDISEGDQFVSILYMQLTSEEIMTIFESFIELLCSGGGFALEEKLTESMIEQIDAEDMDILLGEYIANFLLPSWMRKVIKK